MTELVTAWMLGCICGFLAGVTVARPPRDRDPDWRLSFNHENTSRPSGPPPLKFRRIYYDMPSTIAECGGPCTSGGPEACDCGALWRDVPIKPQSPSPRKIREDFLP